MKFRIDKTLKSEQRSLDNYLKKKKLKTNGGFSLVEALVAMFILGVIGVGISQMSELGFKSAASAGIRQDLQTLKMTIRDQLSCEKTLNLPDGYDTSVPVPCTGSKLTLKKPDGNAFGNPLGSLTWSASCVANKIKVMVSSKRSDPLTGQPFVTRDLFNGIAEGLCSSYFTGFACKAGDTVIGIAGSTPVCGKAGANALGFEKVEGTANETNIVCGWPSKPPMKHVAGTVCCPSGKIVFSGGGQCNIGAGGFTENSLQNGPNCWHVDCCKYPPYESTAIYVGCINP
ncbi:MAG: prepilin-type N-terminal cleavage/methylation domain-containing protein [Pseudomonadota bacterium]